MRNFDLNSSLDPLDFDFEEDYDRPSLHMNEQASVTENEVLISDDNHEAQDAFPHENEGLIFDDNEQEQNSSPVEDEVLVDDDNFCKSLSSLIEKRLIPGQQLESFEQAYILYCEYGRVVGFSVRKGAQKYHSHTKEVRKKEFVCSCNGLSKERNKTGRLNQFKKQDFRSNCLAMLRVSRGDDGILLVSKFNKEHNHELSDPANAYLLRSARTMSIGKKHLLEALQSAGIRIKDACRFTEHEAGGPRNAGFIRKDAYNHMYNLKTKSRIDDGDSHLLIKHFIEMSNKEHDFYWNMQTDEQGRLLNFFFRDSRSAVDYDFFGDVLSIDTTYKTNKYDLICAPFVGVNHHLKNCLFGLAFLSDETTSTFEWLFSTFLESMNWKEPAVVFSDQCQAMMNGIDSQFKSSTHRLCQWHINQNAPSHFGSLNGNRGFKTLWFQCMNGCEHVDEFERTWRRMIAEYNLVDNRWFSSMYNLRARWSSVLSKHKFCAGLHATSRSEVTNKVLKDISSSSGNLYEFVMKYEQIQLDWRRREGEDDTGSLGVPGLMVANNPLLKQVAKYLTRRAFLSYEYEATHSLNVDILDENSVGAGGCVVEFAIQDFDSPSRIRRVTYNRMTSEPSCSCCLWQNVGVLCAHVFKIYYHHNVKMIPSQYLLRRLSSEAKRRRATDVLMEGESSSIEDSRLQEAAFNNHIMRSTYSFIHDIKLDKRMKAHLLKGMETLRDELVSMQNESNDHGRREPVGNFKNTTEKPPCRDPVVPTNRRFTTTRLSRHWEKPRRKKKKMADEDPGSRMHNPIGLSSAASPSLNDPTLRASSPALPNPSFGRANDFTGRNISMPPTPSPLTPISQDDTFYQWPWSRESETLVLTKLVETFHEGDWVKGQVESNALAVDAVYRSLSGSPHYLNIPRFSYHHKVDEWYWHFFNFTTMLEMHDEVWYDEECNLVYASTNTWSIFSQVRPSLLCYWPEGEMNYKLLKVLFETDDESDD